MTTLPARFLAALLLLLIGTAEAQQYGPQTSSGVSSGWNVIYPTNTSADVTTLQAAVNGSKPVFMTRGTWQICSQISVPVNQRIEGEGGYSNSGSSGASASFSRTVVSCPSNGTFSSGQAFFALKDHDVLRGVDIYCNFGSNPQFNGINALNALAPEIDHNTVAFCKEGISRLSDSAVPGATVTYSQLARIHDNFFYENTGYGYFADFANSGFVSDESIGPNNDFVLAGGSTGGVYLHFVSSVQVFDNRCEVGGNGFPCINIQQGGRISITGNDFEQTQALLIAGTANDIQVTGNYGNSDTFGALYNVEFSGAIDNTQFAGNTWTGAAKRYKVDAGGSFTNSFFAEYGNAPATIYNDAYTQFIMQPITATAQAVVANITPNTTLLSQVVGNHISSRGFTPTLSSCGSGTPAVAGDDAAGTITMGGGSPTACTVTFAAPYAVAPQCTPSTNSTSSVPDISAISTSAFTVSLSATTTRVSYTCIEQVPSLVKGGAGLISDWTTFNSSFATAAATSPSGAGDAARITEDSATNRHYIQSSTGLVGSTGNNTISAYIHAGSAGTDNVLIGAYDSGFGNTIGAVFSVVDGSYLGTVQQAGAGTLVTVGSQSVGTGWFRVWLTFTLGAQPNEEFIGLAHGNGNNFTGNSTDNALVWGPAMRAGILP